MLHVTGLESSISREMKILLTSNLDERFPVDPSQRKINIT